MPDIKDILKEYVETANNPEYKSDFSVINAKFPELKNYDSEVLKEYVETANNPKYKSNFDEINSKFPDLFGEKKNEILQPSSKIGITPLQKKSADFSQIIPLSKSTSENISTSESVKNNLNFEDISKGLPIEKPVSTEQKTEVNIPKTLLLQTDATPAAFKNIEHQQQFEETQKLKEESKKDESIKEDDQNYFYKGAIFPKNQYIKAPGDNLLEKKTTSWGNLGQDISSALTGEATQIVSGAVKLLTDFSINLNDALGTGDSNNPNPVERLGLKTVASLNKANDWQQVIQQQNQLPDNTIGNVVHGIDQTIPMIIAFSLTGGNSIEAKLAEKGIKSTADVIINETANPLTKYLTISEGLKENAKDNSTFASTLGAAAEGFKQGTSLAASMGLAGRLTEEQIANLAINNKFTQSLVQANNVGKVFAVSSAANDILSGKNIDLDQMTQQYITGFSFEMPHLVSSVGATKFENETKAAGHQQINQDILKTVGNDNAIFNFLQADPQALQNAMDAKGTHQEYQLESLNKGINAGSQDNLADKQADHIAQLTLQKISDIKYVTQSILENKEAFLKGIDESTFSEDQKSAYKSRINAVYEFNQPIEIEKRKINNEIKYLESQVDQIKENKVTEPIDKIKQDIEVKTINDQIKDKTESLTNLILNKDAVQEQSPAEILQRESEETGKTRSERSGMEQIEQGKEVAKSSEKEKIKKDLVSSGKIILNDKNEVEEVKQNSGAPSQLFKDLSSIIGNKEEALKEYLNIKGSGDFKNIHGDWENSIMKDSGLSGLEYQIRKSEPGTKLTEHHANEFAWSEPDKNGKISIFFNDEKLNRNRDFSKTKEDYIKTIIDPEIKEYESNGNKEAVDKMNEYKSLFESNIKTNRDLKLHLIHNELFGEINKGKEITVKDIEDNYIRSVKEINRLNNIELAKDYFGEPMIYMHSGNEGIKSFKKPGEEGYNKNDLHTGEGIYFSRDIKNAEKYSGFGKEKPAIGKDIYYTFLKYKKPYYMDDPESQKEYPINDIKTLSKEDIKSLKKLGYDAVIYSPLERPKQEIVVFEPNQIEIIGSYNKGITSNGDKIKNETNKKNGEQQNAQDGGQKNEINVKEKNVQEKEVSKNLEHASDNFIAKSLGFDSAPHLINAVKKYLGKEYKNLLDIPDEDIEEVVKIRKEVKAENKQPVKEIKPLNSVLDTLDSLKEKVESKPEKEINKKSEIENLSKQLEDLQKRLNNAPVRYKKGGELSQKSLKSIITNVKQQLREARGYKSRKIQKVKSILDSINLKTENDFIAQKLSGKKVNGDSFIKQKSKADITPSMWMKYLSKHGGDSIDKIAEDLIREGGVFEHQDSKEVSEKIADFIINNHSPESYAKKIKENSSEEEGISNLQKEKYDRESEYAQELNNKKEQETKDFNEKEKKEYYDLLDQHEKDNEQFINSLTDEEFTNISNEFIEGQINEQQLITETQNGNPNEDNFFNSKNFPTRNDSKNESEISGGSRENDKIKIAELDKKIKETKNVYDIAERKYLDAKKSLEKSGKQDQIDLSGKKPSDNMLFKNDLKEQSKKVDQLKIKVQEAKMNHEKSVSDRENFVPYNQITLDKVLNTLDNLKIDTKNTLGAFGIAPVIWNKSIDIIKSSINKGASIHEAIKEAVKYLKEKVKDFDEKTYVKHISEKMGVKPEEYKTGETTSIKNSIVNEERENRGLNSVEIAVKKDLGSIFNEIKEAVDYGKIDIRGEIKQLAESDKNLSTEQSAALLYDRMRLQNEHKSIMDNIEKADSEGDTEKSFNERIRLGIIEDNINNNDIASVKAGRDWGLTGNARQLIIKEDYSLARLMQRARIANGEKGVSKEVRYKIEELSKKLEEAEQKLADYKNNKGEKVSEDDMGTVIEYVKKEHKKRKPLSREQLEAKKEALLNQAKEILANKYKAEIKDIIPLDEEGGTSERNPELIPKELIPILKSLQKLYIEDSINEDKKIIPEEMVSDIYEELGGYDNEFSHEDLRDAISGYGKTAKLSQEELNIQIRKANRELRDISALEFINNGERPMKSGFQRDKLSQEERARARDIKQKIREKGLEIERTERTPEDQFASALDAVKTRLRNRIEDLKIAIEKGEKPSKKVGIEYDEEAKLLKIEADHLSKALEDMVGKTEISDEKRIEIAKKAVEKGIADYENRINELDKGNIDEAFKSKNIQKTPITEELKKLREERDSLKDVLENLKPENLKEEVWHAHYKKAKEKRLEELNFQLEEVKKTGTIQKKIPTKYDLDKKDIELTTEALKVKHKIDVEIEKLRLANRNWFEKTIDGIVKLKRFQILAGFKVLGKLATAGIEQSLIITPLRKTIQGGLAKLPIISRIAEKAPGEGIFSPKAIAVNYATWFKKEVYKQAYQKLITGKSDTDLRHQKERIETQDWSSYVNNIHGAIKEIPKEAEYWSSVQQRAEYEIRKGSDLTDPKIINKIHTAAYDDAVRNIFMNKNDATDLYRTIISRLKSKGTGGQILASMIQFDLPIVNVPTNIINDISSYTLGSLKAAWTLRGGIDKLSEKQSDHIMRSLGKQGVGIIGMGIAYSLYKSFGGFYQSSDKNKELKPGEIKTPIGVISKAFLHHPGIYAMMISADIQQQYEDAKLSGKNFNLGDAILKTIASVASEVPFLEEPGRLAKNLKDTKSIGIFMGENLAGLTTPQIVQEVARYVDKNKLTDEQIKRAPQGFIDAWEMSIPYLREHVPTKEEAKTEEIKNTPHSKLSDQEVESIINGYQRKIEKKLEIIGRLTKQQSQDRKMLDKIRFERNPIKKAEMQQELASDLKNNPRTKK